ncbi:MAG: DUF2848 domain-containing protein [Pseudomonadota bacterium]
MSSAGEETRTVPIERAIIAGWTARNQAAVEEHIAELEKLGVARPARTPMFYRVATSRITVAHEIEAIGGASSGEVEFCLVNIDGMLWVGVGSDHTDREAEAYGVTLSKQLCDKPIAKSLWCWDEVAPHWDQLQLRADVTIDGERLVYQSGPVSEMLDPRDLLVRFAKEDQRGGLGPGDLMMGGTLPAVGGVRPAQRFDFELIDPKLERRISHGYDIKELPVEG